MKNANNNKSDMNYENSLWKNMTGPDSSSITFLWLGRTFIFIAFFNSILIIANNYYYKNRTGVCVHTCDTAVNEKRLHGRTGTNRSTAVPGKKPARPCTQKKWTWPCTQRKCWHGRAHTMYTCRFLYGCTFRHVHWSVRVPAGYTESVLLTYHHTRLPVFQPDQHLDLKKTTKN